ncbi:hypothetical protein [Halobacterium yunchengense]|uniref:hypothetical protein n=1 Tax=Halobacterium yunchengense TaxID=3108497 RepID=UPI00300B3BB7
MGTEHTSERSTDRPATASDADDAVSASDASDATASDADDAVSASDATGSVTAGDAAGSEAEAAGNVPADGGPDGMSERAQWAVVAALVVSGVLAPLYLYVVGPGSFGLGFRDTYLAVPMVPALLLGAIGLWTAVRGR